MATFVLPGVARADAPASGAGLVSFGDQARAFSPDGDGFEDVAGASIAAGEAGLLDLSVETRAGAPVRTLVAGRSVDSGWTGFSWDGTTDGGTVAPEGQYRLVAVLHSAAGTSGAALDVDVDDGGAGAITEPAPADTIAGGGVRLVVRGDRGLDEVRFSGTCRYSGGGCDLGSTHTGDDDARYVVEVDTGVLRPGANTIAAWASWTDGLGASHTQWLPGVDVTVATAPLIELNSSPRYFTPDGDGNEDAVSVSVWIDSEAVVRAEVQRTDGTLVRDLGEQAVQTYSYPSFTWDGLDEDGHAAPDGAYQVVLRATNAFGASAPVTLLTGIERRTPMTLTAPAAGATLSGTATLKAAPGALPVSSVSFQISPCSWNCSVPATLGDDGWSASYDTTLVTSGPAQLTASGYWTDPLGSGHLFATPPRDVVVDNPLTIDLQADREILVPATDSSVGITATTSDPVRTTVTVRRASDDHVVALLLDETVDGSRGLGWWPADEDAAGDYVIRMVAGDQTRDVPVTVDRGALASFTAPKDGLELADGGQVAVALEPAPGRMLGHAWLQYSTTWGCCWPLGDADPDLDGTVRWTVDAATLPPGANRLSASTSFTDAKGATHGLSVNGPTITINRPAPPLTLDVSTSASVLRKQEGATIWWSTSRDAHARVEVFDAAEHSVRVLQDDDGPTSGGVSWSGDDADGVLVPSGTYTARVTVSAAGQTVTKTVTLTIERRSSATFQAPVAGDALGLDPVQVALVPDADVPVTITSIDLCMSWCVQTIYAPDGDGMWRTSLDTGGLTDGEQDLVARVNERDAEGRSHQTLERVAVTVDKTAPQATLSVDPPSGGQAPLAATYHLAATGHDGDALDYALTFDDGSPNATGTVSSGAAVDVAHTWKRSGVHRATLTVTDPQHHRVRRTVLLPVSRPPNRAPTAALAVTPSSGKAPLDVQATVTADDPDLVEGQDVTYRLDWGDGTAASTGVVTGSALTVSHRYAAAGDHDVTLAVRDGQLEATAAAKLHVRPAVPAVTLTAPADGAVSGPDLTVAGTATVDPATRPEVVVRARRDTIDGPVLAEQHAPVAATGTWTTTLTDLPTAAVVLDVTQADDDGALGHAAARSVTVDADPPVLALTSERSGADANRLEGTSTDDGPVRVRLWSGASTAGSPARELTATAADGRWSADLSPALTAGTWTVRLDQADARGLAGSAVETVTITPPQAAFDPPGGVTVGDAVGFDASASQPRHAGVQWHWDFGDGATADGMVVEHAYGAAGRRTVTLTVRSGGEQASVSHDVDVRAPAPAGRGVTVTVTGGGSRLAGATVAYVAAGGTTVTAATGGDGTVVLSDIPDGAQAFAAYAPEYRPASATTTVADGRGEVTIDLVPGGVARSSLDTTELTPQQAAAAGVDLDDPDNRIVFRFTGALNYQTLPACRDHEDNDHDGKVDYPADAACDDPDDRDEGPVCDNGVDDDGDEKVDYPADPGCDNPDDTDERDPVTGLVNSKGEFVGSGVSGGGGGGSASSGSGSGWSCAGNRCVSGGGWSVTSTMVAGKPLLTWLIVSGSASALKEMHEVTMRVDNLAGPGFPLVGGVARLDLPSGVSLPALHGAAQPAEHALDEIPGGSSASATWIVRGDQPGAYEPVASYTGTLQPFGAQVTTVARLAKPLRIWGADGLRVVIEAPSQKLAENVPRKLRFGIKNVGEATLHNVAIDVDPDLGGGLWAPRAPRHQEVEAVAPGTTWWGPRALQVIPDADSEAALDLVRSSVVQVAGDGTSTVGEVTGKLDDTPIGQLKLSARGGVLLDWEEVPGATGYRIYRTGADRKTPFHDAAPAAAHPFGVKAGVGIAPPLGDDGLVPASVHTALVPGDTEPALWAVTAVVDGHEEMRTQAAVMSDEGNEYPHVEATTDDCLATRATVTLTATDPYGLLDRVSGTVNDKTLSTDFGGRPTSATTTITVDHELGEPIAVDVVARSHLPGRDADDGPRATTTLCGPAKQPEIKIDTKNLDCSSGTGTVTLAIKDDKTELARLAYVIGERDRAFHTLSGHEATVTIGIGSAGDYSLRRGGVMLRAGARNVHGITGPLAAQALCPEYGYDDSPPPTPPTPPGAGGAAPGGGTVGGQSSGEPGAAPATGTLAAPQKVDGQPACVGGSTHDLAFAVPGLGSASIKAGCLYDGAGGRVVGVEDAAMKERVDAFGGAVFAGLGLQHFDPGKAANPGEYEQELRSRRHAQFPKAFADAAQASGGSVCSHMPDELGGIVYDKGRPGEPASLCFNGIWQLVASDKLKLPLPIPDFTVKLGSRKIVPAGATRGATFLGLTVSEFALELTDGGGMRITVGLSVPRLKGTTITATMQSGAAGLQMASVQATIPSFSLGALSASGHAGALALPRSDGSTDVYLGGDVQAKLAMTTPKWLAGLEIKGAITFRNGDLSRLELEGNANLSAIPKGPIGITKLGVIAGLGAGGKLDRLGVNVGFGGPAIPVLSGALFQGELAGILQSNADFYDAMRVDGSLQMLGLPGVVGQITWRFNGLADFSGMAKIPLDMIPGIDLLKLEVRGGGWFNARDAWEVQLHGTIGSDTIVAVDVDGDLVMTPKGLGVCAKIPVFPDIGANVSWSGALTPGCNLGDLRMAVPGAVLFSPGKSGKAARAAAAASTGDTAIVVPARQGGTAIALDGAPGAPVTGTVTGPDGTAIALTGHTAFAERSQVWVSHTTGRTLILIGGPKAGRWTYAPAAGSPALARVGRALEAPDPHVTARVRPRSDGTALLTWSAPDLDGRALRLVASGRDGTQQLLTTRRASGTRRIRLADGRRGKRKLSWSVLRDGIRTLDGAAGAFTYPGTPVASRPRVTLRRANGALTVRWSAARGAVQYRVNVTGPGKRSHVWILRSDAARTVRIPIAPAGRWVARVRGVNAIGATGPTGRAAVGR